MQEGLLWGCVAFLWCGFSVSVYLPSSWCVTCRKFAFLFCLGCNWAVFLVRQVKLDTTEFLEKPFFAIVCWNLKLRGVEWGQMTDDGMCSVKCVSNYQVFIYPLLLLASELWMEKKKIVKLKLNQRWWWSYIYQLFCEDCCEARRHCLSWKQLLRAWWNPSFSGTVVVCGQPESFLCFAGLDNSCALSSPFCLD